MTRYLICQISVLVVVFLFLGCNSTPTPTTVIEGIKPIWSSRLPGKSGIYNDGLIGLPNFEGNIFFHSTYFTNAKEEDNRIHALNMETGEINWTFPTEYTKSNSMFFWGVPYLSNEYLVAKMPKFGNVLNTDKLICINLKTKRQAWQKTLPSSISFNSNDDVVGINNDFYFLQQSDSNTLIYKGNIQNGDTSLLMKVAADKPENYNRTSSNLQYFQTSKNDNYLLVGALEEKKNSTDTYAYKTYIYIIDIDKNVLVKKLPISRKDEGQTINEMISANNKVYIVCGRTTFCYNPNSDSTEWSFSSVESYNYMANHIIVTEDVIFLYGDNRFIGLDAQTGIKLYQGDIKCSNANTFNGHVYIIGSDSKLYVLDIKTGKTLHQITCPEKIETSTGFLTSCKPQVYGDKLYVFGNYHAYCYKAIP